jgi:Na+-translocating ferredoxin:NAD+ oxidoreductase RnfC subunit
VPEGGIPLNVGVVVDNVETLFNVFHAAIGTPVTHRTVTVLGEVGTPGVYRFPVGTPFLRAIEAAGGALVDHPAVIDGGPMMGTVYFDLDQVVKKTTSGLIVVPKDHPHVVRRTLATPMEMLRTISMCCQCRECTDLCPRYQLGHDLEPHKVMRAIITRSKEPVYQLTQAHICCLCGICETIACPLGLSPRNVFAKVREELRTNQVPNPHHRKPEQVRHGYAYTKQPKERVLARCGMTRYNVDFPYRGEVQGIRRVEIPLLQHMGAPSIPLVKVGQTVEAGMLIAGIPQGKLGANQHASITGTVTRIGNRIVIEGEP